MNFFQNLIDPIASKLGDVLPSVVGALLILIIGIFLASMIRRLIVKALTATGLDEKVNKGGDKSFSLVKIIAMLVYYLLVIYVLMIVLNMLGVGDVFDPLESMLQSFMGAVPKIVVAAIIGFAGYILAKLVSEAVELVSGSIDHLTTKIGFDTSQFNIIKILKQVVFMFIFIPIVIIAVEKLEMPAISDPATAMLGQFLAAIPNIIAAAIIIGVFYILARFITPMLREILKNVGLDTIPEKVGLSFMGGRSLSSIVANVAFFFIMLAGITSGLERLEMGTVVDALDEVMGLSGRILFGLVIMIIGNFISKVTYNSLSGSTENSGLASIARVAILGVFFSIGLNSMGIANEIVNLAFGLTLGAVAVAVALSFGLGGREAAGKQMEHILKRFRKED